MLATGTPNLARAAGLCGSAAQVGLFVPSLERPTTGHGDVSLDKSLSAVMVAAPMAPERAFSPDVGPGQAIAVSRVVT